MIKRKLTPIILYSTLMTSYLLISCSPTRFQKVDNSAQYCTDSTTTCVKENGYTTLTSDFTVGVGKVDIMFILDNTASMSPIITKISNKFSSLLNTLDAKKFNYKIGMISADVNQATPVTFSNSSNAVTSSDSDKTSILFNNTISEKASACENLIKSYYSKYGADFQSQSGYERAYKNVCASSDERGLFNTYNFLNTDSSFLRTDANLVMIMVSNEDERSALYNTDSNFALSNTETPDAIMNLMSSKYSSKYWEFNSIVVQNSSCATTQKNSLVDNSGNVIRNSNGNSVVDSQVGQLYLDLSNRSHAGIDGSSVNVGRTIDICSSDYGTYFQNISANILESARVFILKCTPEAVPTVVSTSTGANVAHTYEASQSRIVFSSGTEGESVKITYKCADSKVQ